MPPQARNKVYQTYSDHVVKETKDFISFDLYMKCKVKYGNLTKNNMLRIPSFVEWVS
jgi:DNA ligase-1